MTNPPARTVAPLTMRRRFLRFGLRTLLLLMVMVAVPLAWKCNRVRAQRRVVEVVAAAGGFTTYDHQVFPKDGDDVFAKPPGPPWLRRIVGDDFFAEVVCVGIRNVRGSTPASTYSLVAELPTVLILQIEEAGDAELERIAHPSSVAFLTLSGDFTDEGVAKLTGLTKLKYLRLQSPRISDATLMHFQSPPATLEELSIVGADLSAGAEERFRRERPGCVLKIQRIVPGDTAEQDAREQGPDTR